MCEASAMKVIDEFKTRSSQVDSGTRRASYRRRVCAETRGYTFASRGAANTVPGPHDRFRFADSSRRDYDKYWHINSKHTRSGRLPKDLIRAADTVAVACSFFAVDG